MKKIVTSNITDQARLPLLKRTIEFIKENDAETSTASLYAMLGNNSDAVPIILWGCKPTITTASIAGDTLTITEGAILYDGEIYQVAAGSAVFTVGQVHTLIVVATGQTEEPTKYTDNSEHITNINYTIAVSNGVTGSGICDWNNRNFYSSDVDVNSISFPNAIIDSIDTPSGATLTGCVAAVQKRGDVCTLSLDLSFSITNATTFKSFADLVNIVLNSKFRKKPSSRVMWVPAIGQNSEKASWNCEASWRADGSEIECYKSYSQGVVNNSNSFNYRFQITYAL